MGRRKGAVKTPRRRDLKALAAAHTCVEHLVHKADGYHVSIPFWYGWALREAFLSGVAWQQAAAEDNHGGA